MVSGDRKLRNEPMRRIQKDGSANSNAANNDFCAGVIAVNPIRVFPSAVSVGALFSQAFEIRIIASNEYWNGTRIDEIQ
jgi:hypothetical protein